MANVAKAWNSIWIKRRVLCSDGEACTNDARLEVGRTMISFSVVRFRCSRDTNMELERTTMIRSVIVFVDLCGDGPNGSKNTPNKRREGVHGVVGDSTSAVGGVR
jgi:hypothetical protein